VNRKYCGTPPVRNICITGVRTDISNEIFAISFRTRIIETELNKEEKVVKKRKTPILPLQ
jgi:hypothetical protein